MSKRGGILLKRQLKNIGKIILFSTFDIYYWLLINKISYMGPKRIFIFDIDNTIANSWPTFLEGHASERERLMSIKPFSNFQRMLGELSPKASKQGSVIVFLSARPFLHYSTTRTWLRRYFPVEPFPYLFVVPRAVDKCEYLETFSKISSSLVYIDDLSFGHERGRKRYYDEVITRVSNLGIEYFGDKDIDLFKNSYDMCSKFIGRYI